MRQALAQKNPRHQTLNVTSLPAPVGGLNAVNSLADMPPTDAIILDNWFCEPSQVRVRKGIDDHVTGLAAQVQTLAVWSGTKLFAASNGSVYNVTSAGALGAAEFGSMSSNKWQWVNFGNSAGTTYLIMVNGTDAYHAYDGSSWTTPSVTGATAANFIYPHVFKYRLFFVEKNTTKVWYLAEYAISGAATVLDMGPMMKLGGSVVALANVTTSAGQQVDDYFCAITSEGEAIVFKGIDPTSANTWSLVGTYRIGIPIGNRCVQQVGQDVMILTEDGITPLANMFVQDVTAMKATITQKILDSINLAVQSYKTNFGWHIILSPFDSQLIVNVPISSTKSYQFVMNTTTGSWSTWGLYDSPLNAFCWAYMGSQLYFGSATTVTKANTGNNDNGAAIIADGKQAFNYFGQRGSLKHFKLCRPNILIDGSVAPGVNVNVDFEDVSPDPGNAVTITAGVWDTGKWDSAIWGGDPVPKSYWLNLSREGYCAATRMKVSSASATLYWMSTDIGYESGGVI